MNENNETRKKPEVNKLSIEELFFNLKKGGAKEYQIPIYQRDYRWNTENVIALLEDINLRQEDGENHYFGIIAMSKKMHDDDIIIKIMDGQQRIVTSFLILYSLHELSKNKLKKISESKNAIDISNKVKQDLEKVVSSLKLISKFKLSFEMTSLLQESFEKLVKGNGKEIKKGTHFYKNLEEIKKFLTKKVGEEKFLSFKNIFVNNFFVANINYVSTAIDEEIIIFENINAKGERLNDFEMISNYLISLPNQKDVTLEKEKLMKIRMEAVKLINQYIKGLKNFYKCHGIKITSKYNKVLTKFLETYLKYKMAKSNVNSNKEKEYKYQSFSSYSLYKNFKAYFKYKEGISIDKYKKLIYEMSAFLVLYLSFKTGKGVIEENIWLASYTEKFNHFSVLFAIFDKFASYKNTDDGIIEWKETNSEKIQLFSKSIVEYHLKHLSVLKQGKSLSIFWFNVLQEFVKENKNQDYKAFKLLLRGDNTPNRIPSNYEFRKSLLIGEKGRIPKFLEALIKILNYYFEKKNTANEKIGYNSQVTFEHVFPQKPIIIQWPKFSQSEEEYRPYINMLGNIVLLDKKANSKNGNKDFKQKKHVFSSSSSPLVKGGLFGLKDINNVDVWGPKIIICRTKKLTLVLEEIFEGDFT